MQRDHLYTLAEQDHEAAERRRERRFRLGLALFVVLAIASAVASLRAGGWL